MGWYESQYATWDAARAEIDFAPSSAENIVRRVVDRESQDGFQWKVWLVAGSGFFTTAYSIFSTNVITPALLFVYPPCNGANDTLLVNVTTLAGVTLGMLVFGFLADQYGRKTVYGFELAIVIIATVGLTTATSGKGDYMNIYGWIGFWRCLLGVGLGAEYPLSALISVEWSSTRTRAKMLASVFLMQSLGQLAAYALGLAVLALIRLGKQVNVADTGYGEANYDTAVAVVDEYWRIVVGIGAAPALVAVFLRLIIPETPLWLGVHGEGHEPARALEVVYDLAPEDEAEFRDPRHDAADDSGVDASALQRLLYFWWDAKYYLSRQGRWRILWGVTIAWILVDIAFYGLGLDSPRTISQIWLSNPIANLTGSTDCHMAWQQDPSQPDLNIFDTLQQDTVRNMITISSGTVIGSVILILVIDYVPRVTWMGCWFVALAALFLVNGCTFFVAYESSKYALTITFYVLAQVMFNLGPNTITFILPAELFDTRFRGTFYGFAAASAKVGAIAIQVINSLLVQGKGRDPLAGLLLALCPVMLLGALFTWVWIPEVQYPRGSGSAGTGHEYEAVGHGGAHGHHVAGAEDGGDDGGGAEGYEDGGEEEEDEEGGGDDDHGETEHQRAAVHDEEQGLRHRRPERPPLSFRQRLKLPSRPLEDIARDPWAMGQRVGFKQNMSAVFGGLGACCGGCCSGRRGVRRRHKEEPAGDAPVGAAYGEGGRETVRDSAVQAADTGVPEEHQPYDQYQMEQIDIAEQPAQAGPYHPIQSYSDAERERWDHRAQLDL